MNSHIVDKIDLPSWINSWSCSAHSLLLCYILTRRFSKSNMGWQDFLLITLELPAKRIIMLIIKQRYPFCSLEK